MIRFLIVLLLASCMQNNSVRGYKYMVSYPYLGKLKDSVRFTQLKDTLLVFYYKDYVLYQIPEVQMSYNETGIVSQQKVYSYFAYKKKEQYGYAFYNLNDSSTLTRVWTDSFLNKRTFKTSFSAENRFRVDSSCDPVTKVIFEKFVPTKMGEYVFDSVYFYYSPAMRGYDFSLSKKQDSLKKDKLFQVRLLYNQYFSDSNNIMMPKREFQFKFEKYEQFDLNLIIAFLDKFKGRY